MKISEKQLLYNLYGFMRKQAVDCIINEESQWEEYLSLAHAHKVLPMVYDSMGYSGMIEAHPLKFRGMWKSIAFQEMALQIQSTATFLKFYEKLLEEDMKCLVVKGIVCRSLYLNPDARISGDEDLFLSGKDFAKFRKIAVEFGFVAVNEDEREWAFFHKDSGLKLEVHMKLFDDHSRTYADFNLPFEDSMENAVLYDVHGVKIWTMNETDHMLYLILHSFKHLLHSGVGIRQICDMIIYAEHFGDRISWKHIFHELRAVNADVWFMNLLDIGKRYFGFSYKKAGISPKVRELYQEEMDSKPLLEDIIKSGVYGTSSQSRTHSSLITLNAVAAAKEHKSTKGSVLRTIFPSKRHMENEFSFVKRFGFLLPIAWMGRILRYGVEIFTKDKNISNSARESIQIGNKRVELLRKYKVI